MCARRERWRMVMRHARRGARYALLFVCLAALLFCADVCPVSAAVATDDERAAQTAVAGEDMLTVTAAWVEPGDWPIEVASSSSMFKIVDAVLHVPELPEDGMTADITLSGTGYIRLFMGTGEEAVAADAGLYSEYGEDAAGAYHFAVPVEALNAALECTGFSRRKEKWYDHQICFLAESLPVEALRMAPHRQQRIDLADGIYRMNVTLDGGSGKASLASPTTVAVKDGEGTATLVWSSPNYDYMLVNQRDMPYDPVNAEGNSVFEIPVYTWDAPQPVIADTTAMSAPHEILYRITFDTASAQKTGGAMPPALRILLVVCLTAAIVVAAFFTARRTGKK